MARTPTLQAIVDLDEHRAGALLTHPMQRQARRLVVDLLEALPEAESAGDLFEFQRSLLGTSLFVAEAASQLRRGEARTARGKLTEVPLGWEPVSELASADEWLFELTVADRMPRPLARRCRSVWTPWCTTSDRRWTTSRTV